MATARLHPGEDDRAGAVCLDYLTSLRQHPEYACYGWGDAMARQLNDEIINHGRDITFVR
jgi:hypothetical protein